MAFLLDEIGFFLTSRFTPVRVWIKIAILASLILIAFLSITSVATAWVEPPASYLEQPLLQGDAGGKTIFDEKCIGCHTIGGGNLICPDLQDVTKRRDLQWIKDFITDPAKMIASDPTAQQLFKDNNDITMPTLGLSPDQVDQLVEYLSNPEAAPASPPASSPISAGDPVTGRSLFTGELALANNGPSCMSCHAVSGTGILGGGGLGPDLTHVVQRLGEPGLSAALKTIAFPTMLGPFQNRPLTPKEQVDLVAFLKDSDRWQDPVQVVTPGALTLHVLLFFSISLVGAGLLFGLLLFIWIPLKKRYFPHLPVRKV